MSVTGPLSSVISHAAAKQVSAQNAAASSTSAENDTFGPATKVTLSAAAQSVVSGQSSGSGASSAQGSGTSPAGGGIPIATSSTASDEETLIEEAYQEVIPKVGVTGASEVVDSKGDIDQVKLNELIAQQNQLKPSPLFSQTA